GFSGIFKTTNGGSNWSAASTGLPANPDIRSLAIDRLNTATVYAGGNRTVFKSTDSGGNWSTVYTTLPSFVTVLVTHPSNSSVLYSGSGAWIHKSTNGGTNWNALASGGTMNDLVIDPVNPSILYASRSGGVYKTSDGGATWSWASSGIGGVTRNMGGLGLSPANTAVLYAGMYIPDDGFITELSPDGTSFLFSTFLGGPDVDGSFGLAVGPFGEIVASGITTWDSFPITPGAFQKKWGGNVDAFLVKIGVPAGLFVKTNKTSYADGDIVTADEFRLKNPAVTPTAIELRAWLGIPGSAPVMLLNLGANGSFVLPAGINTNFGPLSLFTVTSGLPRGSYELGARSVDPPTGRIISESLNPFSIQ
ncbi:MAG: YCF48-related protein, partial [Pseudomonadota bacterium]